MNYAVTDGSYGANGASGRIVWIDTSLQLIRICLTHHFGGDFTDCAYRKLVSQEGEGRYFGREVGISGRIIFVYQFGRQNRAGLRLENGRGSQPSAAR